MIAPNTSPNLATQRAAIAKLAFLVGVWDGVARAIQPDGASIEFRGDDVITLKNGGTILVIHGRAFAPGATADLEPERESFGIIHYDDAVKRYGLKTFAQGLFFSTGEITAIDDGYVQWTLPTPEGLMRFDLSATGKDTWKEEIYVSADGGATWRLTITAQFLRRG